MTAHGECPFCENILCNRVIELTQPSDTFRTFQVVCGHCKARGPVRGSEQDAAQVWNRRTANVGPMRITRL